MGFYRDIPASFVFANALNQAMAKAGKTQYWLAKELGVSQPYVTKMATGATVPSIAKTELIASILGFSLSDFIKLGE